MDDKSKVLYLLHFGLVDIRNAEDIRIASRLADLFHTVPLKIDRAIGGQARFEEIMHDIALLAKELGLERWLNTQLARCDNRSKSHSE